MQPPTEKLNKCPACNSVSSEIFLNDNYPIEKCDNCSVLFVNPRPTEASIRKMFRDEYIKSNSRIESGFVNYRKASLQREANTIKKYLTQGGKILDLGTASGEFLRHFAHDKWNIKGIEPSIFAAEYAQIKNKHAEIFTGFLDEFDFHKNEFDAVTSLDTFYFHSNPSKDIERISEILKDNGYFMIELPNLRFHLFKNTGLLSKLLYKKSSQLNAGVHLFYYIHQSLEHLLNKHGFRLVSTMPEQSPTRGGILKKILNIIYFKFSSSLYSITNSRINIAPKEVYLFKKV